MQQVSTRLINAKELPLVIEPLDKNISLTETLDLLVQENEFFIQNLLRCGGLLLRNFPVQNADDFASVIKHLNTGRFINYIGGDSPRKKIIEGVYTSTEAPPSFKISLHNELSYVKQYPGHIYFYCDIAPLEKGETIIGDARKIYQSIDPSVRERFLERGLQYISRYPYKNDIMNLINKSHKSWINVFETEDKNEVEKKCSQNEISYTWNKNDWLEISQIRPSALCHPITHENVWFNQAHQYDLNPKHLGWGNFLAAKLVYCRKHTLLHEVFFADGSRISREDLYHIMDVLNENTIYFPWQKGDVLVLDNILAMHGRAAFKGKRRILTAMTS